MDLRSGCSIDISTPSGKRIISGFASQLDECNHMALRPQNLTPEKARTKALEFTLISSFGSELRRGIESKSAINYFIEYK